MVVIINADLNFYRQYLNNDREINVNGTTLIFLVKNVAKNKFLEFLTGIEKKTSTEFTSFMSHAYFNFLFAHLQENVVNKKNWFLDISIAFIACFFSFNKCLVIKNKQCCFDAKSD